MRLFFAGTLLLALSACGGGSDSNGRSENRTGSGFAGVSGGTIDRTLSNRRDGSVSIASVGTAVYAVGVDQDDAQIEALAGISGTPNVGAEVRVGRASYDAQYEYFVADNVSRSDTFINGDVVQERGNITLNADFGAGTLTGSTSELTVDGTIDGTELDGSVTADYSGAAASGTIDGDLGGDIGSTGVIGIFAGDDSNTALSGGFVGTVQ